MQVENFAEGSLPSKLRTKTGFDANDDIILVKRKNIPGKDGFKVSQITVISIIAFFNYWRLLNFIFVLNTGGLPEAVLHLFFCLLEFCDIL